MRKVDELPASCSQGGYAEYYICDRCGARFYDEKAEEAVENIEDLSEAALGFHTDDNNDGVCDVCGEKEE